MKQRTRIYYSAADKASMWDRWQKGESMTEIAKTFNRAHSSVFQVFQQSGGIRPAPRKRSRLALTLAEREEISRGLAAEQSIRTIASSLGRSPSTVSREINRNGGLKRYRASKADQVGRVQVASSCERNPDGAPKLA
jgi:IS30 family transposase